MGFSPVGIRGPNKIERVKNWSIVLSSTLVIITPPSRVVQNSTHQLIF